VTTWSYDGQIPGAPIQVTAGEVVRATVANQLPAATSIHWHGIALRNDADGVPEVTQPPIDPGGEFTYEFTAPHPGTYWFHPHSGTQLDRGLYAPLIVDDPAEPGDYDQEWTVVLDDWLDDVTGTPEEVLDELRGGMGHGMMGQTSSLLGGDAGDVRYPHFLLNGKVATAPETFQATPGTRLRLRIVNAGGDTAFRVALGGHTLTVTHTDGFPVEPVETDAVLLGMGERYDLLVTLADGVFPLVAMAEGKGEIALGLVRTGSGEAPGPDVRPSELDARIVSYRQLVPTEPARLADRPPDRTIAMELTGGMMAYDWGFDGRAFDHDDPTGHIEPVRAGERVRLELVNTTMMWHPLHLHGHTFAIAEGGPRKDTANVLPGRSLVVDFDADNPGLWMLHCHNIYHAEAGMMAVLGYQR
jgi:FtsP/CotA-like multicopper oxidase with cupredoxin domain